MKAWYWTFSNTKYYYQVITVSIIYLSSMRCPRKKVKSIIQRLRVKPMICKFSNKVELEKIKCLWQMCQSYTNADLEIRQYLYLYMKIICWRFHIKKPLLFEICALEICEKFVYKHSQTIDYVKNSLLFKKLTNFTFKW